MGNVGHLCHCGQLLARQEKEEMGGIVAAPHPEEKVDLVLPQATEADISIDFFVRARATVPGRPAQPAGGVV
jgi:hypothetical protein